jgi:hypothetical protein
VFSPGGPAGGAPSGGWGGGGGGAAPPPRLPQTALAEAERDRQVRGFLGWRAYLDAGLACERGLGDLARVRLGELGALVPEDRRAQELAASCATAPARAE